MPGLFIALSKSGERDPRLGDVTARLSGRLGYEVRSEWQAGMTVAEVVSSPLGHSRCRRHRGIDVWVYGAVFTRSAGSPSGTFAETVADCYERFGDAFVNQVNGEFTILIRDERKGRFLVANDRFAIRPWYWTETGRGFYLSPSASALLPLLDGGAALDEEIVLGFLAFNKLRLGDRTVFKGISVLPAASLWTFAFDGTACDRKTYWQFRYSDEISKAPVDIRRIDDIVDCYRDVMNRRAQTWPDARVGISLSGGLDSRTMIAALDEKKRSRISSHTFGLVDSDEVQLAILVANTAGIESHVYPLAAADYVDTPEAILDLADELDIFVQAGQEKFMRQAVDRIDVLMTGIDLDVTLGGIYLEPDIMAAKSLDDVFELLTRKNIVFDRESLRNLVPPSLWARAGESTFDLARNLLRDLPQTSHAGSYDLFINQFSMRRIIMLRYAQIRSYLETASPMYDYEFIDLVRALPLDHRAKHASFIPFLERLSPELAQITYQRTMLPATAPRHLWAESEEIERRREALYLKVWRETGGKVEIPYRRYYTNFDEWLRLDRSWRALTDRLLCEPEAKIYQLGIAERKPVAAMIEQHRTGERGRRQQLIVLMSLELFLRRHF